MAITKELLLTSPWKAVAACSDEQGWGGYWSAFESASKDKQYAVYEDVFKLIASIVSVMYKYDPIKKRYRYTPLFEVNGSRSFLPQDLSPEMEEILFEFSTHLDDCILKAKILDAVWGAKGVHKFEAAKGCIEAYNDCTDLDDMKYHEKLDCFCRAIDIAIELRSPPAFIIERLRKTGTKLLAEIDTDKANAFHIRFFENFLQIAIEPDELLLKCENCILSLQKQNDFALQRDFIFILIENAKKNKANDCVTSFEIRIAESYVYQAEAAPNAMSKSHFYQQAVQAYRRLGMAERANELHKLLIESQKHIYDEMGTVATSEIEIGKYIQFVKERVSGKPLFDALFNLAFICELPDLKEFTRQAFDEENKNPILDFFTPTYVDSNGKTVATPDFVKNYTSKPRTEHRVITKVSLFLSIASNAMIFPGVLEIRNEHHISYPLILDFIKNHPLIPNGFEQYFARGITAGFDLDFPLACMCLVTQIENSLRYIIEQAGGITSSLDANGQQKEKNIDVVLEDNHVIEYLGSETVDTLKLLLVDPRLSSLRHSMAHGLMPYDSLNSHIAVYFWWLVLRIIFTAVDFEKTSRAKS